MKIPPSILRYGLAMNASAFDAAVHSSVTFFGVAGAHAAVEAIPALNLQQFAAVFLLSFGRACLGYLDAHPLDALVAEVETEENQSGKRESGKSAVAEASPFAQASADRMADRSGNGDSGPAPQAPSLASKKV
jgi:hypothetical protein